MINGENGGGHKPWQSEDWAEDYGHGKNQEVQVVPTPLDEAVLLPVDNHGSDLLQGYCDLFLGAILGY